MTPTAQPPKKNMRGWTRYHGAKNRTFTSMARAGIAKIQRMGCFAIRIAERIGLSEMMQTNEQGPEYLGGGWQIVEHTCSRYFGPEWREEQVDDKGIVLPRGLYGKNGRLEQIMKMILHGRGTREICREAHATGRTVRKYRDILQKLTGVQNEF